MRQGGVGSSPSRHQRVAVSQPSPSPAWLAPRACEPLGNGHLSLPPAGCHPSHSDLHVGARHRRRCVDLVLRCDFDGAWHRPARSQWARGRHARQTRPLSHREGGRKPSTFGSTGKAWGWLSPSPSPHPYPDSGGSGSTQRQRSETATGNSVQGQRSATAFSGATPVRWTIDGFRRRRACGGCGKGGRGPVFHNSIGRRDGG